MGRDQKTVVVVSFLLSLVVSYPTVGGEIYHWVDEDGVMNFSEWAPNPSVVDISRRTITKTNPPDYDPHEDQSSISKQAERTNFRWSELKARRDERRVQRIDEAERASRLAPYAYEPYAYYESSIWYGPVQPRRLGHHHMSKVRFHQQDAADRLGLRNGRRPYSINSSAHLARITASKEAIRGPRPRHGMRRSSHPAPRKRPSFRDPQ